MFWAVSAFYDVFLPFWSLLRLYDGMSQRIHGRLASYDKTAIWWPRMSLFHTFRVKISSNMYITRVGCHVEPICDPGNHVFHLVGLKST